MEAQLDTCATKVCTSCGACKPLADFSPNSLGKMGRKSQCKACQNAKRRMQYASDSEYRERLNQSHREKWALDLAHRARSLTRGLLWSRENLERRRHYTKTYRLRNPEKVSEQHKLRNALQPEKYQARNAVHALVLRGDFPPASALVCEICQEAQAQQYHHWHGYDEKHQTDVIAVCHECHGKEHSVWDKVAEAEALRTDSERRKWGGRRN